MQLKTLLIHTQKYVLYIQFMHLKKKILLYCNNNWKKKIKSLTREYVGPRMCNRE